MALRPAVIRDQDKIDVRLTAEAEYLIPFTFIEALNEGTLFDRPAHAFLEAARERRLFHVLNRTTDNILGTGIIQASGDEKSSKQAEVGGLMFHPAARGFGLCSLLVKIMMVYAIKENGRDSPDEEYLAHVVDGNGAPLHSLLDAGFRPIGPVDVHRGDIDAVIDHMIKGGESVVHMHGVSVEIHEGGSRRHHSIRSGRRHSDDRRFLGCHSACRSQDLIRVAGRARTLCEPRLFREGVSRCIGDPPYL